MTPIEDADAERYLGTLIEGLKSVGALTQQVKDLDDHVTISEETAAKAATAVKRTRMVTRVAVVVSVLALIATGLSFWSLRQNCLAGNAQRAAAVSIWDVVLQATDNNPQATKQQKAQAEVFRTFVHDSYRPHDCWNLLKDYQIPAQPNLVGRPEGRQAS